MADPIYETTRLLFDSKTKQYDDKLYKLVVGMGTSRSSILGEATINLADYADASQPSVVDLPLQGSVHGTILHVTVQLLTAKTGFREFEQQRDKGLQSGNNVNKETEISTTKSSSELQIPDDLVNKARTRMQHREETNIYGEYSDSQVTCDESSTKSDNYYADKHDSPAEKTSGSNQAKLDDDLENVYEENRRLRASLAVAKSSISELNQELSALQSHATEMGNETQKLAQELTTEIALGEELIKEVNFLKLECSKLKGDIQNLKEIKSSSMVVNNGVLRVDLKNETIGEIPNLHFQELDIAKAEKENLVKKMDQMECYYESLVHELEENQKRILNEFQNVKNEMNDLSSVNNELQKRVTISESALKRARLNDSIAVSQLQKDLDMLSFQVLSMFETNQTVIKEAFADTSQPSSKHLSDDLKRSLSIQENIYKKVEEELGEMCCANLQLSVYSETLVETLYEACDYIGKMNEKLRELEVSNKYHGVLIQENAYYLAKCNDLQLQNQMLETDLGNFSHENFILMEKITECEALLMEYRVYKGKHEVVSAEKLELEKLLEVECFDKQNLQKEIETLRSEIDDVKMKLKNGLCETMLKLKIPNSSFEKLHLQIDSVTKMFKNSLESGERHAQNSEVVLKYLSSLELELQKLLFEDRSFHEQIIGLESMAEEFENSKLTIYDLRKENQDLMICVENTLEERDRLKECLDVERGMKINLEARLNCSLENEVRYTEENINLAKEVESFKLKLEDSIAHNAEILNSNEVLKATLENVNDKHALKLKDMLTKSKTEVEQFKELQMKLDDTESRLNCCLKNEAYYIEENTTLATEVESAKSESNQLKELLTKSNEQVAGSIKENRKLITEIESHRLELQACVAKNAESENEHALKVGQLQEMLTKSKEEAACYIEENKKLAMEIESLRLELQSCVSKSAEILESNLVHALEVSQVKEVLTKSKEELARYIEENRKLVTEIESLRLEFQASIARNAESQSVHALEVSKLNEVLTKSKEEAARYIEDNKNLATDIASLRLEFQVSVTKNAEFAESNLKVAQLEEMLTKSKEEVARFIEDNKNLAMEVDSLRSELQVYVARNAESQSVHAVEASQLKEELTKSKEEVACYIRENRNLEIELESVRSEFQATVARNAESRSVLALEASQLKEALTKSKEEVAHYIEENRNLETGLGSLRLDLHASVAKNGETKEEHALEMSQLKEMLTMSKSVVARYIEDNKNLTTEVESLKLKIENYTAHNAETKLTEVNYQNTLMADDVLISMEESKIASLVLKEKLEEQNDELIMMQNNCNQLRNKLSEQILKTEEFKNLSIYLKELKGDADVAQYKKEKESEGPTESLRMAFVKEQYQMKIQELKQQVSVSKRHNEEMLFKLQDSLNEIESRKKSEASQLRRIQELEAEGESDNRNHDRLQAELECAILSLECCKEEKEKLVCLLQESEDEKLKIVDELSLIREKLAQKVENGSVNGQEIQGLVERTYEDEEISMVNDSKQLAVDNDQFRTQHLISCMEQLDEELEKMKNDNSLPLTIHEPSFQDLQQELAKLHQANEELGSIYPNVFNFPGNGNALERVLALEIELAETLRTKKKASIQFQSSFLKQHSDEEAVFKSFRDINDLIKDMLEIKAKYVNVENELKEMHDRYSQLSLQFAEVEGERQKLMMILKNVRSSRNLLRLNRSSMAALGDQTL